MGKTRLLQPSFLPAVSSPTCPCSPRTCWTWRPGGGDGAAPEAAGGKERRRIISECLVLLSRSSPGAVSVLSPLWRRLLFSPKKRPLARPSRGEDFFFFSSFFLLNLDFHMNQIYCPRKAIASNDQDQAVTFQAPLVLCGYNFPLSVFIDLWFVFVMFFFPPFITGEEICRWHRLGMGSCGGM